MWDRVVPLLRERGLDARAIDLRGDPDGGVPTLDDWIDDVLMAIDGTDAIVVGHSMGGVVARAATGRSSSIARVVLVDAPMIRDGQRAVDVSGPPPPTLPAADTWIPPRPVGADQGFEAADLREWVNARLVPTPFGPSLDVARVDEAVPVRAIFFARTPEFFPCAFTRREMDETGITYRTVDTHHDGPLLTPESVAEAIVAALED